MAGQREDTRGTRWAKGKIREVAVEIEATQAIRSKVAATQKVMQQERLT